MLSRELRLDQGSMTKTQTKVVIIDGAKYVEHQLSCPECSAPLRLRASKYGVFYGCSTFPKCRSAHGAHPNGEPLGIPATREVKDARISAHAAFDQLWEDGDMTRGQAYRWLRESMDLSEDEAHIGRFDLKQCRELEDLVADYLRENG